MDLRPENKANYKVGAASNIVTFMGIIAVGV